MAVKGQERSRSFLSSHKECRLQKEHLDNINAIMESILGLFLKRLSAIRA